MSATAVPGAARAALRQYPALPALVGQVAALTDRDRDDPLFRAALLLLALRALRSRSPGLLHMATRLPYREIETLVGNLRALGLLPAPIGGDWATWGADWDERVEGCPVVFWACAALAVDPQPCGGASDEERWGLVCVLGQLAGHRAFLPLGAGRWGLRPAG